MEDTKKKTKSNNKRINKLSKPKRIPTPTTPKREYKPLNQLLQRLEELTQPPSRLIQKSSKSILKGKSAEKSSKTKDVCKPKKVTHNLAASGKDSNLEAHISERLERLALPIVRIGEYIHSKDPSIISQRALRYKPSPRILQLARPKRLKNKLPKKPNKFHFKFNKKISIR